MPSAVRASHASSFLLVLFLFVAFFPGVFHYLFWSLPLAVITADPARLSFTSSPRGSSSSSSASSRHRCASSPSARMSWFQTQFTLPARARGSYLITDTVTKELPEIKDYKVGLLHLFIQHTSCALSLNENWDEDVRKDMSNALDRIAPDAGPKGEELYLHSAEGPDDMPVSFEPSSLCICFLIRPRSDDSSRRPRDCFLIVPYISPVLTDSHARPSFQGSHKVGTDWRLRLNPHLQRQAGHGNLAGNLVSRV